MIGFIGLGIMGSRMAANLLNNGFELIVFNRTKEKASELLQNGAQWADSPGEVASKADIVFTMLTNPGIVEQTAFGENGFINEFAKGKLWIDCSTVDPSFSKKMAAKAAQREIRFMDAPVAGSTVKAENAELIFLVGGEEADLQDVKPLLEAMGKQVLYQGKNGTGSAMKLVINLMLAQSMAAFSEAVSFGEAMGIDKENIIDTLLGGATTAPFLKGKKAKLLENEFSADAPLEHVLKDMNLISETAYQYNIALPIANITKEIYSMANQKGLGKLDFAAIYQVLSNKPFE
jgi:3-hydroxyisobutyrate dehydrogenase-like beta-hydroxyacid dehydrogenase